MSGKGIVVSKEEYHILKGTYEFLRQIRPETKQDLRKYINAFLEIDVPDKVICTEHCSPLDYLWHAFNCDFGERLTADGRGDHAENTEFPEKMAATNGCGCDARFEERQTLNVTDAPDNDIRGQAAEDAEEKAARASSLCGHGQSTGRLTADGRVTSAGKLLNGDCVVWANRGGGKTELAAVATLLDCVFKPGCQSRILAGSEEQAGRMYQYLTDFLRGGYERYLDGRIRKSGCQFRNGSAVNVLTQSQASVRGQHVQKIRCDEIELFDPDVFNAAKFVTLSSETIMAAMESISTMHRPYGLMQKLVSELEEQTGLKSQTPVFKWCILETIEQCVGRNCSQCPLWGDCAGRAKEAAGYLKIDDCITQMRRSSRAGWEAEMLCIKPNLDKAVFDQFDPAIHVKQVDYDANLPLYRTLDFGFVNPFVCLWIQVDNEGVVRVIDEYVRQRATIDIHAAELKNRTWHGLSDRENTAKMAVPQPVIATFCDPAGTSTNDVSGTSAVGELRSMGIRVQYRKSAITEGVELIRRAIRDGANQSRFIVSPKCSRLIEALTCYHYPDTPIKGELPLKDGVYDHPIDALRYFFVNFSRLGQTEHRLY